MAMKIAICEDDLFSVSKLQQVLEEDFSFTHLPYTLDTYDKGNTFCNQTYRGSYDLVFLSTELPDQSGIEVGRYIRNVLRDEEVQIVFMSSRPDDAIELFACRPLDFLLKPIQGAEIKKVLATFYTRHENLAHYFRFSIKRGEYYIGLKDILYFSSDLRKITVHMRNQEITFYDHLDRIYSELRYDKFLYVHKSYLVNYNNIVEVSAKKLIMSNGEVIPISQSRRKNVKEELKRFDLEGHVLYGKTMERGAM